MEHKQNEDEKHHRVLHPYLFAVFPVLSLFSAHIDHVSLSEVYLPFAAMLCIAGGLWLLLWPLLPQRQKRGLAISASLLPFFAYGPVVDHIRTAIGHPLIVGNLALGAGILCVLVVAAGAIFSLRRSRRSFENATAFLNMAAACSVLVSLGTLGFTAWHATPISQHTESVQPAVSPQPAQGDLPDIYYILLDAYARDDILRSIFNYDNSPFISFLKDRGFYIADRSNSNYLWTLFSLSSSLNLDYLTAEAPPNESQREFELRVQERFRRNKVLELLKQRGYTCISFTSGYSAAGGMEVDVTLKPGLVLGEFQNLLINLTPLRTLLGRIETLSQYAMHRKRILYTLDQLPKLRRYGKPLFVFAHVTIPHPPFVLDENGDPVHSQPPIMLADGPQFFASGASTEEYIAGYTKQMTYLNARMRASIDDIIRTSPDAIMLVQGDHGSRLRLTDKLETTDVREAAGILNAYRLPGRNMQELLSDRISPVNSFRVVFNAYFGAGYPILKDRTYSGKETGQGSGGWRLVEITDRLK